jgi:hypothetical protein
MFIFMWWHYLLQVEWGGLDGQKLGLDEKVRGSILSNGSDLHDYIVKLMYMTMCTNWHCVHMVDIHMNMIIFNK